MDEFHRQAYLKAMGIPVWLPRVQLPHAKPAFLLDYKPPERSVRQQRSVEATSSNVPKIVGSAVVANSAVMAKGAASTATRPAVPQDLINAIAQAPKDKVAAQVAKQAASSERNKTASPQQNKHDTEKKTAAPLKGTTIAKPPKFSLQMYRLSPACFVVSDCALGEDSALQSARDKLLLSMLKATFSTDFIVERCDYCHWPLVKNPQVDQGPLVAQQAVAQLIAARCQSIHALQVLLMGDAAQTYASGFPVYMKESDEQLVMKISVSLDDLLTDPKRKREAWSDIKRCLEA